MSEPIRAIVITVSDRCSRGEAEDVSGAVLMKLLKENGAEIVEKALAEDARVSIIDMNEAAIACILLQ